MPSLRVLIILLPLAVAISACSSATTSCDESGDCFSGQMCLDSICVAEDDIETDVGMDSDTLDHYDADYIDDGGDTSKDSDASGDSDTSNGDDVSGGSDAANGGDATGDNDASGEEHQCSGSALLCESPTHNNFNSYYEFSSEVIGCVDNDEFEPFEATSEVFTLCGGDTHYFRDRLRRCPDADYFGIATVEPKDACPTDLVELRVTLGNFPGGCDNDAIECSVESDGTHQVRFRIPHDGNEVTPVLRLFLDDISDDEILYDYEATLRTASSLD